MGANVLSLRSHSPPPLLQELTMNKKHVFNGLTLAASIGLMATSLLAQSFTVSPDPSCATLEGQLSTHRFGWFNQGRYQLVDGTMRGNAKTIRRTPLTAAGMRSFRILGGEYTDSISRCGRA